MPKTVAKNPSLRTKWPDARKALQIISKIKAEGPDGRFRSMSEAQIIHAIKWTREDIWRKKLNTRP